MKKIKTKKKVFKILLYILAFIGIAFIILISIFFIRWKYNKHKTCGLDYVWSNIKEECLTPSEATRVFAETNETYVQDGYGLRELSSSITKSGNKIYEYSFKHHGDPGATYFLTVIVAKKKIFFGKSKGPKYSVKNTGSSIDNLIAEGWYIEEKEYGDLNFDGRKDLVFIIHKNEKNLSSDSADRVLVIYFYNEKTNLYELQFMTDKFVPGNFGQDNDYGQKLIIIDLNGVLSLNSTFWTSFGSWYTTHETYKFRYNGKDFIFIGYDYSSLHRGTMEEEVYSVNFLTKKMSKSVGKMSDDSHYVTEWNTLKLDKIITIEDLSESEHKWSIENLQLEKTTE